jgi:hypothetical protein
MDVVNYFLASLLILISISYHITTFFNLIVILRFQDSVLFLIIKFLGTFTLLLSKALNVINHK